MQKRGGYRRVCGLCRACSISSNTDDCVDALPVRGKKKVGQRNVQESSSPPLLCRNRSGGRCRARYLEAMGYRYCCCLSSQNSPQPCRRMQYRCQCFSPHMRAKGRRRGHSLPAEPSLNDPVACMFQQLEEHRRAQSPCAVALGRWWRIAYRRGRHRRAHPQCRRVLLSRAVPIGASGEIGASGKRRFERHVLDL